MDGWVTIIQQQLKCISSRQKDLITIELCNCHRASYSRYSLQPLQEMIEIKMIIYKIYAAKVVPANVMPQ